MGFPGPSPVEIGVGLAGFLALAAVTGEGFRLVLARWIPLFRPADLFERLLLDAYLAGAAFYLLAAAPFGLFTPVAAAGITVVGVGACVGGLVREARHGRGVSSVVELVRPLRRPLYLVTAASAVLLAVVEVTSASAVPTGNTFDSSVDTLFVSLLQLHASLPTSLSPVATGAVAYPQGSTVWFLLGQWTLGLPPARTVLLVTPLFLALAPLAGFVVGRRWTGSEDGGAAVALTLALLGGGTRYFGGGSNDFVLAFPLVLLLAGFARGWLQERPIAWRDALAFGALLGYSAVINPVGAEWLAVALPVAAIFGGADAHPPRARWLARYAAALAIALPWVAESIWAVWGGTTGSAGGGRPGIPLGSFVSRTDPFLVRANVEAFAPFALLTVELAALFLVGALILALPALSGERRGSGLRRLWLAGFLSALGWVALGLAVRLGAAPLAPLTQVTSVDEMSTLLFTLYALLGSLPLALVFRQVGAGGEDRPAAGPPERNVTRAVLRFPPRPRAERRVVAVGIALVLLVPGAAFTVTAVPSYLGSLYGSFSNVTTADVDLLVWAGAHLPNGARVLVAPGSAAEFLPGYQPRVVLLFPMVGAGWRSNASYLDLESRLANATLGPAGFADLADLDVQYVAVTGNSTVLYPAFSPAPFVSDPAFREAFHEADAYLFEATSG